MVCIKCGGTLVEKQDLIYKFKYLSCFNCGKTYQNTATILRFRIQEKNIKEKKSLEEMKLLVKIPSRERPDVLFKIIDLYVGMSRNENTTFLISLDDNDETMTNLFIKAVIETYANILKDRIFFEFGKSKNKIDAINRDVEMFDWDIILLTSDDMIPQKVGYDDIIIEKMKENFPDTDGILWFNDGYTGKKLNTLPILGRTYYNRFNYIYNPEYITWWADNEFTIVGNLLNKQIYFDDCIIKHEHPVNNKDIIYDNLYDKNDDPILRNIDEDTFNKRIKINFEVDII